MTRAYLGVGSNLGDKVGNIRKAVRLLGADDRIQNVELSPLYRSAPVGKTDQDWFVNGVIRLETKLSPRGLLEVCLETERALKRVRDERWGPRTLDLDILLFGELEVNEEGLEVPHPRLLERAFVLRPLSDLSEDLLIDGKLVAEWSREVSGQEIERMRPRVAILGASEKEDRYANRAQKMLMEKGYETLPVSPLGKTILEVPGVRCLQECDEDVDTVTIYIGSSRVQSVEESVVERRPRRVIFNPGTENAAMRERLAAEGIEAIEACTLVMLATDQF